MKQTRRNKHGSNVSAKSQSGVMLLEALIGILIFSLGILALVGMQATALRATTDARDRTEASNLASQVVGEMWLDRANLANYVYDGSGTPPAALNAWVTQVENSLPGAAANHPTVTIGASAMGAAVGTEVEVTVFWQNPSDPNLHQFAMTAYIN
ncbi:MAG: pilus assembly protein PilV [Betaproteobacteria bacterium]|nr:MAG: pilus assembly protein PilV [Betaproteobacteria bacterium]